MTSLTSTTFGAALVRGFLSEDWARGHAGTSSTGYVAPTMPAHFGPAIYVSPISVLSRRPTRIPPRWLNHWLRPVGNCQRFLGSKIGNSERLLRQTDFKCRGPRDKLSSAVLNFPFAALRFIIKGLTFANANHILQIAFAYTNAQRRSGLSTCLTETNVENFRRE